MKPNSFWRFVNNQVFGAYIPPATFKKNLNNFAALENALGYSPLIKQPIVDLEDVRLNSYPQKNVLKLKTKIADWLNIESSMISIGNGSDQLINLIPQVFLDPAEACIVQTPTFFRIIESIFRMKGKLVTVSTKKEENFSLNKNFLSTIELLTKQINPKIIWLCSPNNPTGEVIDPEFIDEIARKQKALVIVDEAYQEFFDPENRYSAVRLLKRHKNLLITKTFSKAFGLAGIRIGFAIGNKSVIGPLEKWQLTFPVSSISLKIAEIALDDKLFLKRVNDYFSNERNFLFNAIDKMDNLKLGGQSQTNVFIIKHNKAEIFNLLLKRGILTANFNDMNGLEKQRFVRITIKSRTENKLLLQALKKIDNKNYE